MIHYQQVASLTYSEASPLYEAVGWTNYTEQPEMLEKALQQSAYLLIAYDGDRLVGLLRAVGDGVSIMFVQDILVLPAYQRRGIGRHLVTAFLAQHNTIYQIHLLTDQSEKTESFYSSLGFETVENIACRAFTYIKNKKEH